MASAVSAARGEYLAACEYDERLGALEHAANKTVNMAAANAARSARPRLRKGVDIERSARGIRYNAVFVEGFTVLKRLYSSIAFLTPVHRRFT